MSLNFEPAALPPAEATAERLMIVYRDRDLLVCLSGESVTLPTIGESDELGLSLDQEHYLGRLDGIDCFATHVPQAVEAPEGHEFAGLRALWTRLPDDQFWLGGRGYQIVEWDRTHRHCGRCGTPTEDASRDRAKLCPSCGLTSFPRLSPAVIVCVTRGDEILLAQGTRFPGAFYSVLAGFVEPGESLEETVAREVKEEVGIEVDDIRYFGSQPWPFPHSLMIGFSAVHKSGDLVLEPEEIAAADWYTRDSLPELPPRLSIARTLIDAYLEGSLGSR
jgi:NAD+ diphosphatase